MSNSSLLDRIGIELEYTDITPSHDKVLSKFLTYNGIHITHDASVETPTKIFMGVPVKDTANRGKKSITEKLLKTAIIGGELVSPIIDTSDIKWIKNWDFILHRLKILGERTNTKRGSIHIHVNFPYDPEKRVQRHQRLLKLWVLAGYTEAFFFRIGGMGRPHRGNNMDYIYCRPITGNGPQVVFGKNHDYVQLVNYDDVLEAGSYKDFMYRMGDSYYAEQKYHPCRYMWISFYSLKETAPHFEFRVFNKTLRWDYLYAIVELCKAFCKKAWHNRLSDIKTFTKGEIYPLHDPPIDSTEYFKDVLKLLDIDLDSFVGLVLRQIWDRSNYPVYDNKLVFSHIADRNRLFIDSRLEYYPHLLTQTEIKTIKKPNFVDVHWFENNSQTQFPEERYGECAN